MRVTNIRLFQQIRLWIYWLIILLTVVEFWNKRVSIIDFIIFLAAGLLLYLEFCPKCGRLVWWETRSWPNALWIGATCRNCGDSGDRELR